MEFTGAVVDEKQLIAVEVCEDDLIGEGDRQRAISRRWADDGEMEIDRRGSADRASGGPGLEPLSGRDVERLYLILLANHFMRSVVENLRTGAVCKYKRDTEPDNSRERESADGRRVPHACTTGDDCDRSVHDPLSMSG